MKNEFITPAMTFSDDTVYTARSPIDISCGDTVRLEDSIYLSVCDVNSGYLDTAFLMRGLKNVTLDFGGNMLTLHGRIQPFMIDECENITIKNVAVQYDRSFYSEFDVISNVNGELRMKKKANFPCRVENGYLIPYAETWENRELNYGDMFIQVFDTASREGAGLTVAVIGEKVFLHDTPPCHVAELKVREEDGDVILSGEIPAYWHEGMTAVLSHETRDKSSAAIFRSKNITLENYRIINGAGMGVLGMYTENLTLDRLTLTCDELSHGIVTNEADAMHLVACRGKLIIKNSVIEGMIDDALNVHSNFYLVSGVRGSTISAYKVKESHCLDANFKVFGIGDEIAVYRGHTMERKAVCRITDIRILDNYNVEFDTDAALPSVEGGDIIENLSAQPELIIQNCRFGKANTHLRIQTRGKSVIENCESSLPVLLTGDLNYWFEASPVNDLTIRNCSFTGSRAQIRLCPECNPTPKAPYYHRGVKITDNTFDCATALNAVCADRLTFRGNTLRGGGKLRVELYKCGEIDADCETARG